MDNPEQVRTVLLMGETGSGKSTLINSLANYFLEGSLSDLKIVIPNREHPRVNVPGYPDAGGNETNLRDRCQTKRCLIYEFKKNGILYRFIYTPGFSGTRNPGSDDDAVQNILQAASDAGTFHAIVLIFSGPSARVTVNLKSTLERIGRNAPDVLIKSTLAVFTKCNRSAKNFDETWLPYPSKKSICVNNIAFSSHADTWSPEDLEEQEFAWKISMSRMREIVEYIDTLAPESTQVFRDMLESRRSIKSQIMNATIILQEQATVREHLSKLQLEEAETALKRQQSSHQLTLHSSEKETCESALGILQQKKETSKDSGILVGDESKIRKQLDEALAQMRNLQAEISKAENSMQQILARRRDYNSQLQTTSEKITEILGIIMDSCRKLKAICPRFNLAHEMEANLAGMRTAQSSMTTSENKAAFEAVIQAIEQLIRPNCEDTNVRSVLIMGETGSGKSTFINSIANYFLGGSLSQLKIVIPNSVYQTPNVTGFPISTEADLSDRSRSKTKSCTVYEFTRKGIKYRFIVTPDFSDTENSATSAVDDQTVTHILQAASAVGTLHAIIIVINGSAARVTVNLKRTLERIGGNSPDILIQSMLAVFTNSSQSSRNFDERSLPYPPKKVFAMDNMAFSSLPTTWDDENQKSQELSWKMSMRQMNEIVTR